MKAIITGAAGGIGRQVAVRLAGTSGTQLVLTDRNADGLEETARLVRDTCPDIVLHVDEIAQEEAPARIVDVARQAFGGLDAIVSNAGMLQGGLLKDLTVASFEAQFAVHTRPTWLLGKAAYSLLARSGGSIVAVASISSDHATPPLGAYSASKAALVRLVEQMALEWGPDGIRCNCVSPGPTLTPMTAGGYADAVLKARRESTIPLRRLGAPGDIAAAITFLLGPDAAFITGVNLAVDGGLGRNLMPVSGAGTGQT